MKTVVVAICCLMGAVAYAESLACADDENTFARYCYQPKAVRVNGDLRATQLYTGGPNSIADSGFLSVINCKVGYLEMRDRRGVAFARAMPEKKHIKNFRDFICNEKTPKQDNNLK